MARAYARRFSSKNEVVVGEEKFEYECELLRTLEVCESVQLVD